MPPSARCGLASRHAPTRQPLQAFLTQGARCQRDRRQSARRQTHRVAHYWSMLPVQMICQAFLGTFLKGVPLTSAVASLPAMKAPTKPITVWPMDMTKPSFTPASALPPKVLAIQGANAQNGMNQITRRTTPIRRRVAEIGRSGSVRLSSGTHLSVGTYPYGDPGPWSVGLAGLGGVSSRDSNRNPCTDASQETAL